MDADKEDQKKKKAVKVKYTEDEELNKFTSCTRYYGSAHHCLIALESVLHCQYERVWLDKFQYADGLRLQFSRIL